ncbi:amino acid ABC transporter permease, partial [Streptococcus suis]
RYFVPYISVSLVYWALSVLIESFGRFLENKMAIQAPESVDISGVGGDR